MQSCSPSMYPYRLTISSGALSLVRRSTVGTSALSYSISGGGGFTYDGLHAVRVIVRASASRNLFTDHPYAFFYLGLNCFPCRFSDGWRGPFLFLCRCHGLIQCGLVLGLAPFHALADPVGTCEQQGNEQGDAGPDLPRYRLEEVADGFEHQQEWHQTTLRRAISRVADRTTTTAAAYAIRMTSKDGTFIRARPMTDDADMLRTDSWCAFDRTPTGRPRTNTIDMPASAMTSNGHVQKKFIFHPSPLPLPSALPCRW